MTAAIISSFEHYPTPIANRFAEWMDPTTLGKHWDASSPGHPAQVALKQLLNAYPEDDTVLEFSPGDPRTYLTEEICFVGVKDGVVGIHTEVELDCEFNDVDDPSGFEDEITREEFKDIAELYWQKLEAIAGKYPETSFFISHGDAITYRGRVCLNAFTPLKKVGDKPAYITPYQSPEDIGKFCQTIQRVADDLIDIILQ